MIDDQPKQFRTLQIVSIAFLALVVRLPGLSASFYGDEGFSLLRDSNQLLTPTEDRFRPLYFSLLYLWKQLGFHGEVGLRGMSLVFGVLQIPVAFALGKRLAGARAGLVFAVLLALDPILIEFSQELRMYSLVPLIALCQAWAFVAVIARRSEGRPVHFAWAGFVVSGVLGVYAHFHYWFLFAGFGVAMLRRRRELPLGHSALSLVATVLLYLPNVTNVLRFQREAGGAAHLTSTDIPSALPKLVVADSVGFNYFVLPDMGIERAVRLSAMLPNVLLGLLVALPTALVAYSLFRLLKSKNPGPVFWLGVELFVVPVLVSFCATMAVHRNFVHPKYMVFSAPFLPLLLAAGYLAVSVKWQKLVIAGSTIGVFGVAILHFNQQEKYGRREDWRGAAAHLRGTLRPDSVVLRLGNAHSTPLALPGSPAQSLWDYYAADLHERTALVSLPTPEAKPEDLKPALQRLTAGKRDVYYLWGEIGRNFDDPNDHLLAALRESFGNEERLQFNPRFILYRWQKM